MTRVAAIQMCSSDDVDKNLKEASQLIEEAAIHGAKLIVLPEMFAIVTNSNEKKKAIKEEFENGKIQSFLSSKAEKCNVWIVGGTVPIACTNNDKVKAACLVFNSQGKCIARYDKIHLFDVTLSSNEFYKESDIIEPGNQIVVVSTPFGKLGIVICYDIRFPLLFSQLMENSVEIIAVPAAFTVKTGQAHWQLLARSRAVENFSYVIGACQGGKHNCGRETYGHSLIVDPWGEILQEAIEPGKKIIYADINLKTLHKIRSSIPVHKHQKQLISK